MKPISGFRIAYSSIFSLILITAVSSSTPALADQFNAYMEDYLTIGSVEVTELPDYFDEFESAFDKSTARTNGARINLPTNPNPGGIPENVDGAPDLTPVEEEGKKDKSSSNTNTGFAEIDQIVNLGKAIWKVVEANKPVVDIKTDSASAVPKGITHWMDLQGWNAPRSRVLSVQFKNLYGSTVVDFTYRLLYTHGGNIGGKGKYLANITVVPASVSVAWGYKFNANVSIPSVTNAGSSKNPVAAAELLVTYSVDTVLKHMEGSYSYYVRGDGMFQDLSNGAN